MLDPEQRGGAAAAPEELELLSIPKAEGKSAVPRVVEGETIKGSPHPPAATDEAARTPGALAHDGVFSNLPARPELMQLPKNQDESPPVGASCMLEMPFLISAITCPPPV